MCGSELSEVDNSVKLREFEQRKDELADLLQLRAALLDVRDAEPPLYKRPLSVDPAASDASDGLMGGAGGSRSVGMGHVAAGGEGESTLGKSRGPAAARDATSAPPTSVPWMLSASEAAAAAAARATGADAQEAAAGDGAAGDAQAQAWEERVRAAAATISEIGASGQGGEAALAHSPDARSRAGAEGAGTEGGGTEAAAPAEEEEEEEEEVVVLVQGLPMPFSAVTEEDQQRMTSEEFARYEELYAEAVG